MRAGRRQYLRLPGKLGRAVLRQQGFAMLELTVAVLVATLLAVWGASQIANRINDAAAQAVAVWMSSIRMVAFAYLDRHKALLRQASGTAELSHLGYADWTRPRLAELKAAGLLSAGFPELGVRGLGATIRVVRSGTCPGDECRIEALVHSSSALPAAMATSSGDQLVAQWLLAAQGQGGAVMRGRSHQIGGAAFQFPNPPVAGLDPLPDGTVAMAVTAEQLAATDYLRVRDGRDPDLQGTATVKGDIHAQASVNVQGYLSIGAEAVERTACPGNGLMARAAFGALLVCWGNVWMPAGGRGGGGYSTNTRTGCAAGTYNLITGACTCPLGYGAVRISESGSVTAPEGLTRGYLCIG